VPISVILQNLNGDDRKGQVVDGYGGLNKCLPIANAAFPLLQYVDPYGNAIFNKGQMPQLLKELELLIGSTSSDEEKILLESVRQLARRCWETEHLYLRFCGD
jgi:hypothetical protein